jgi:hypothetical protein
LYLGVEFLHADQVDGLEAVAVRSDEVEARVDPGVVEAEVLNLFIFKIVIYLYLYFKIFIFKIESWKLKFLN